MFAHGEGHAMSSKKDRAAQEEILEVEREFGDAMTRNDAEAIGRFLSDDWIIIDPNGGIIDKSHFLAVIKSGALDRKSTRLNSSHSQISYAVFCLKKKKKHKHT